MTEQATRQRVTPRKLAARQGSTVAVILHRERAGDSTEVILAMLSFYQTVMDASGEVDQDVVERGTAAVLAALRDRLSPEEARDITAQLPTEVKPLWAMVEQRARQEPATSEPVFYERVMRAAGLGGLAEARWISLAVFGALRRWLAPREAALVVIRLPEDVRPLWLEARAGADDESAGRLERRVVDLERRMLEIEKNLGRTPV